VRKSSLRVFCACLTTLVVGLVIVSGPSPVATSSRDHASAGVIGKYGKLPLYFIENHGQVDERVGYYAQGAGASVYFRSGGVMFALGGRQGREEQSPFAPAAYRAQAAPAGWAVMLEFLGANKESQPTGLGRTEAIVSYFRGPRENSKTGLSTYSGVVYKNLWPGIDLEYAGTNRSLKYTLAVAPGADPEQIRLAYRGPH
jgi:hypothetical protein